MKNTFYKIFGSSMIMVIFSFSLLFLMQGEIVMSAQASSTIQGPIVIYDEILSLSGCNRLGADSCGRLDGTGVSRVQKTVTIRQFVSGSGYLGLAFDDRLGAYDAIGGGFHSNDAFFETLSGDRTNFNAGALQVFDRGYVTMKFVQPFSTDVRLPVQYHLSLYFMPHTALERQQIVARLQADVKEYFKYQDDHRYEITALCRSLTEYVNIPSACPQSTDFSPYNNTDGPNQIVSNSSELPELDFIGRPIRAPEIYIKESNYMTFIGEPVTIYLDDVYDPDGMCQLYQYTWDKPDNMQMLDASVDAYLGDLFFIPQNAGVFTISLRVKELCREMGSLTSLPISIRVLVKNKAKSFPDLENSPYQNSIYQLYHKGVMSGYSDGTMRPRASINRAEFLKLVFESLDYDIDELVYSPRYADVNPNDWFAPYVYQADILGVIKGYPNGSFRPYDPVSLVEALKIVMAFSSLKIMDGTVYSFQDVSNHDWFSRYIQTAFREGILDDITPGGLVRPGQTISRGKAARIVVRTLLFPVNVVNDANGDVQQRPDSFEDFSSFTY